MARTFEELRSRTPRGRLEEGRKKLDERGNRAHRRSRRRERAVDVGRRDFDASQAARETARASFQDFREDMGRGVEELRGQQVGRGRLRTGFGFEDEDRLVMDFQDRLSRDLAHGAFTAAGMNLRNIEGMSADAARSTTRSDDILIGQMDRDQAELNTQRRRRQNKRRGVLSFLGGAAGAIVTGGSPAGAAIGSRLGGAAADAF